MSPKKGKLGSSFQSPAKTATPSFKPKASLIQSPAKRIASPFKSSLFAKSPAPTKAPSPTQADTENLSGSVIRHRLSFHNDEEEPADDHELSMVEEVARDIFGIELSSSQQSAHKDKSAQPESGPESGLEPQPEPLALSDDDIDMEPEQEEYDGQTVDEKLDALQAEIQREPDDFGTLCFNNMEALQKPFEPLSLENLEDEEVDEHVEEEINDVEQDDAIESEPEDKDDFCSRRSSPLSPAHEDANVVPDFSPTLDLAAFDALVEPSSPAPVHGTIEIDAPEQYEAHVEESVVHQALGARDDYEIEEPETEDDHSDTEATPVHADFSSSIEARSQTPEESGEHEDSPLREIHVPPTAPTPPVPGTSSSIGREASVKSNGRMFDFNTEDARFDYENSPFEFTESDIPTPAPPSLKGTPHTRRRSNFNVDMAFTPLVNQLSSWQTNTPKAREGRPRRRGVFSLVGPLDQPGETHIPDEGKVSYPDLSRPSLANTPRLFAELPLQPRSNESSPAPAFDSPASSPLLEADDDMIDSPTKNEIFEDNEPVSPGEQSRFSLPGSVAESNDKPLEEENKENSPAPPAPPSHTRQINAEQPPHRSYRFKGSFERGGRGISSEDASKARSLIDSYLSNPCFSP
ncbi:hypothetical protein N7470_010404 [Penicillium chermesinum]|nr:hypothetical protein N7470_010404 [Penicillium chermesinum]